MSLLRRSFRRPVYPGSQDGTLAVDSRSELLPPVNARHLDELVSQCTEVQTTGTQYCGKKYPNPSAVKDVYQRTESSIVRSQNEMADTVMQLHSLATRNSSTSLNRKINRSSKASSRCDRFFRHVSCFVSLRIARFRAVRFEAYEFRSCEHPPPSILETVSVIWIPRRGPAYLTT
jgi:hypothetical protein